MGKPVGMVKLAVMPFGLYTEAFEETFRSLGNVEIVRGRISDKMIHHGVKNSPVMMCYPYKFLLGYMMDVLDRGATKIVTITTDGECRLKHFWKIQEHTLRGLGYDNFEFAVINSGTILKELKNINPKASWFTVTKAALNWWKKIKEAEGNAEEFNYQEINKADINILVVGEFYTILVKDLNLGVIDKLKKFGARPKYWLSMNKLLRYVFDLTNKDKYFKKASVYLNGPTGGFGVYTLASVIYGCENGYDGIVHVMPMSCSPEIVVEPALTSICKKSRMPLLMVECDENNSELNLETRIETFVELIKRKKTRLNG